LEKAEELECQGLGEDETAGVGIAIGTPSQFASE